jgi:hypothetical protein
MPPPGDGDDFLPLAGYEGAYEIRKSERGRVTVKSVHSGKTLRPKHGRVSLYDVDAGAPRWVSVESLTTTATKNTGDREEEEEEAAADEAEEGRPSFLSGVRSLLFTLLVFVLLTVSTMLPMMAAAAWLCVHKNGRFHVPWGGDHPSSPDVFRWTCDL